MSSINRKPWTNEETEALIRAWDDIGSIILLSILLGRSTSSVQTQASRISLPRRNEKTQRHRRRWSRVEERMLQRTLEDYTTEHGRVRIYDVAKVLNRSVDAIAAKLIDKYGSEEDLIKNIEIPPHIQEKLDSAFTDETDRNDQAYAQRGEIKDTRTNAKRRNCLTCQTPFWSEGAHNRICDKCKRAHENDEAYGAW